MCILNNIYIFNAFSEYKGLNRHVLVVHEGRKDQKYEFCGKFFSTLTYSKKHILRIHESFKDDHKNVILKVNQEAGKFIKRF